MFLLLLITHSLPPKYNPNQNENASHNSSTHVHHTRTSGKMTPRTANPGPPSKFRFASSRRDKLASLGYIIEKLHPESLTPCVMHGHQKGVGNDES